VAWIPGCGTLSEINFAEELGCEIVKIFPAAEVGGPSFVKAIKAPCPWTEIMPSGGVSPDRENLETWFKAGVACVGLGSQLTPKDVIEKRDFKFIEEKVRESVAFVKEFRKR
jgi:2-dehydro-3-deoxyphosphogluconate aldolase/(4S)-4-hydroxy-2-oxoglutarate aldolase